MRTWILAVTLLTPSLSRADWKETVALATGVLAAPVILAGAAVTGIKTATAPRELPPDSAAPKKHQPPELSLVPVIPAQPPAKPYVRDRKHDEMVQLNDTMTNAALAVGGAALLTGIIVGIAKHH
jgi:hypothetical protein